MDEQYAELIHEAEERFGCGAIVGAADENAPIVGRLSDGTVVYGDVDLETRPDADQLGAVVVGVDGGPRRWRLDGPWLIR